MQRFIVCVCIYENISMRFQKTVQPNLFWSFIEPLFQVPFGVVNFTTCIQSPYAVEDRNNKINCNDRCVFSEFYYIHFKNV